MIVFGRPEIGKSSFVANLVVDYLKQGLKVVYLSNEEPPHQIMLNMVRCSMGYDDDMLRKTAEQSGNFEKWAGICHNLALFDAVGWTSNELTSYVGSSEVDVVVVDQADKVSLNTKYDKGYERLKDLYVGYRELAKRHNCLVVAVSQASADAENKMHLSFDMLDGSKTGKAGEADVIIGIGKNAVSQEDGFRHFSVSKNKISGWHGTRTAIFNNATCNFYE